MQIPSPQMPAPEAWSALMSASGVDMAPAPEAQPPSLEVGIPPQAPKVGIIGAGIGGLYAAYLLQKQGIEYEILEAGPRLGGRLYTQRMGDRPNDYYVSPMLLPSMRVTSYTDVLVGCWCNALP